VRPARAHSWRCKSSRELITANEAKRSYRELKALGATQDAARQVAGNCHRWWRNSRGVINTVLTIAYLDRLGVPRLS
jgi:hypothetical protein